MIFLGQSIDGGWRLSKATLFNVSSLQLGMPTSPSTSPGVDGWMDGWMERRKERNRTNIRCALDFSRLYWDVWIFNGVCLTWPPCCNSDHQSTHKEIALEIQLILSLHGQNTQNPTAKGQLTANHTTSQGSIDNAQLLFFALVGNLWCYFVCFGREFMVFFWWCFACCCERFHICFLFWCFERRETMPNFLV